MIEIEVLLTETQLAEDFLAGLERRYLGEKFFYWLPLSVKAWLDLCSKAQPYKNYSRSYRLLARKARNIARRFAGSRVEVVSLGAGQGDKELLLLRALRRAGCRVSYRPVDSSQALLEIAVRRAADEGFEVSGLKADLEDVRTYALLAKTASVPRLVLVLGNSLGVMNPVRFLTLLRKLVRRRDALLADGEIFNERTTMAGYDNPVNRRFAFAPLASVGLESGRDGALVFTSEADPRTKGLHLIGKFFRAARRLRFLVAGKVVEMRGGEKIAMNASWKYSPGTFEALLRRVGRLKVLENFVSDDRHFLLVLTTPAAR